MERDLDHSASSKSAAVGYDGAIARAFCGVEGGGTEYSVHSLIPVFTLQNGYERWDIKWEI